MLRAFMFAAVFAVTPSLPYEVAVVRLNTANASSVAKELNDIFVGSVKIMPVGESRLIVVGEPQAVQAVTDEVRSLCP